MMHYFNPLLQHIFSTKTLTGPILFSILFCLPSWLTLSSSVTKLQILFFFFFKPHVLIFLCVKRVDLGFLTAYLQYKPASSSALLSPQAPSRQPPYRPHTLSSYCNLQLACACVLIHHWSLLFECTVSPGLWGIRS